MIYHFMMNHFRILENNFQIVHSVHEHWQLSRLSDKNILICETIWRV